jgi:glucose-1-phosphate thymidylyltransferase
MKGVILAGGSGTRLRPLTKIINKNLLPVGKYPMIHYAIAKMVEAGIDDILLVIGKQSADLYTKYIGSGSDWNVRMTYKIQEEAGGIAHALALAKGFIRMDEKFLVLLGDNLFEDSLETAVRLFANQKQGAMVFLKEVADPRRFGVPDMQDGRVAFIEEKPDAPKSNFCVTGIYMYDAEVFDVIGGIGPSKRGELEITDVNNVYAAAGSLTYSILDGWWTDAGTHRSLSKASVHWMEGDLS